VTLLLNRELVSRANSCLVSVFPDTVKDCPKMRNLAKIFLGSFENMAPGSLLMISRVCNSSVWTTPPQYMYQDEAVQNVWIHR